MLLDLMLPGIDGYQVCREIRSKHNTPIIMLSAKGEVFDKVLTADLATDLIAIDARKHQVEQHQVWLIGFK